VQEVTVESADARLAPSGDRGDGEDLHPRQELHQLLGRERALVRDDRAQVPGRPAAGGVEQGL
jgi:hypothetical protein